MSEIPAMTPAPSRHVAPCVSALRYRSTRLVCSRTRYRSAAGFILCLAAHYRGAAVFACSLFASALSQRSRFFSWQDLPACFRMLSQRSWFSVCQICQRVDAMGFGFKVCVGMKVIRFILCTRSDAGFLSLLPAAVPTCPAEWADECDEGDQGVQGDVGEMSTHYKKGGPGRLFIRWRT